MGVNLDAMAAVMRTTMATLQELALDSRLTFLD